MPTTTYTYTTPGNYTTSNTEVTGGVGKLTTTTAQNVYTENVDSDSGFTYNAAKAEFTAGQVQSKSQLPTNSILGGNFTSSLNLDWSSSSTTAILNGTPTNVGGKIVCTGTQGAAYAYTTTAIESHKFIYTPNYTTTPPDNINIFSSYDGTSSNDRFYITNSPSGNNLRISLNNNVGASVFGLTVLAGFSPVAGVDYEFLIVLDSSAGTIRVFINGTLVGTSSPGPWSRGGISSRAHLGASVVSYNRAEASFDKFISFTNAQAAATYTPGYTVPATIYAETSITAPEVVHAGPGTNISLDLLAETVSGSPKYSIQLGQSGTYLYWTGSAWSASNGTYAQSNTVAEINTNKATLPISGESYFQWKFHFPDSNTQAAVSALATTITENIYNSSGHIITNSSISADALASIANTVSAPAGTTVKYGIVVDGSLKYWNGSAWAASSGSEGQMNTEAEINTNAATLLGVQNSLLQFRTGFFVTDVTQTPTIDQTVAVYDFGAPATDTPDTCVVWGYINDLSGAPIENVTVTVKMVEDKAEYREAASRVLGYSSTTTTDSTGYWNMSLIRSSEYEGSGTYKITFVKSGVLNIKTNNGSEITFSVPDSSSVDISTLITDV